MIEKIPNIHEIIEKNWTHVSCTNSFFNLTKI